MKNQDNFKFRDIKTYGSTEWLSNNSKKYRSVFDEQEASYIYCEFSFFNKKYDEADWQLDLQLKCIDSEGNEICDLNCDRTVEKKDNIVYIREGWGVKTPGTYWKAGVYKWEVWSNKKLIGSKPFYIEKQGVVKNGLNPYFSVDYVKLYEGPDANIKISDRKYYKTFNALTTRYIWAEFSANNLVRKNEDWACELSFVFRTNTGYAKGSITKIIFVKPNEEKIITTIGWGSDLLGTWGRGKYFAEVVFMDELVASVPFEVGDDYVEALEEDFAPMQQTGFIIEEDLNRKENNNPSKNNPNTIEEVMKELDELTGLESIKTKIKEYSNYLQFISLRKQKGFADEEKINLNAVFKGNPGTGKTTVARMLGKIYKELGLLKKGHVHEVDRADLVAEFIGQTAPKTKEAIKKAKDGILFIDEAYSLARKDDDSKDFGKEAIEILLKEMSDNSDMAVIVAGYPTEMEVFLSSNPGLKSRFNMVYDFPDYVPQELIKIAEFACEKRNVHFTTEAKDSLYKFLVEKYRARDRFFGNARLVHSLVDEFKMNLGLRIMKTDKPENLTLENLSTIEVVDIEKAFQAQKGINPDIPIDEDLLKESVTKLRSMMGLTEVKNDIEELIKLVRFYKETGKNIRESFFLHSVFLGNPGTGKTTVARILAQIYKALGILERGHLVECDRQSMVGGYIGQTAIKTTELIDKSMGGVLFIDEAYALTEGGGNDYGKEAVETLLKRMEDQRGQFIVIAAGYTQNMEKFLESNPGLKSRFDKVFTFADFAPEDLYEIALNQLKENGITPDEKAAAHLKAYIAFVHRHKDKYFGNGREVRKIVEEAIRNQHLRLSELPKNKRTEKIIHTLTMEDIAEFSLDNKPKQRTGIGFNMG